MLATESETKGKYLTCCDFIRASSGGWLTYNYL